MKVYRYEKDDGGGPWFTLSGKMRPKVGPEDIPPIDEPYVYGCSSIEELEKYFINYKNILNDCKIVEYEIPINEVIVQARQILFPKKYIKFDKNKILYYNIENKKVRKIIVE